MMMPCSILWTSVWNDRRTNADGERAQAPTLSAFGFSGDSAPNAGRGVSG
jgi:hypothetical protein